VTDRHRPRVGAHRTVGRLDLERLVLGRLLEALEVLDRVGALEARGVDDEPAVPSRAPNTSVRASPLGGEIATPRSPRSIRTAGDPPIFVASSAVAASSATNWISPSNSAFGPRLEVAAPRAARVSNGNEVGVMRRWWRDGEGSFTQGSSAERCDLAPTDVADRRPYASGAGRPGIRSHPHATSVACWKPVTTRRAAMGWIASVFVSRRSAVGEARPR
jgi:hypothetical protein